MWASQEVVIGLFGSEKGPLTPRRSPRPPKFRKIVFFGGQVPPIIMIFYGGNPPECSREAIPPMVTQASKNTQVDCWSFCKVVDCFGMILEVFRRFLKVLEAF